MPLPPSISLFFPCFNEAANLPRLITEFWSFARDYDAPTELLVVDDGSEDDTVPVLQHLRKSVPILRWTRHPTNRGYGAALRTGFLEARNEIVFFTDGDNQFGAQALPSFLTVLQEGIDGVVGYRAPRTDPMLRRWEGWAWNSLVQGLFKIPFRDVDCAYKVFRRATIATLPLHSDGAAISVELLSRLVRAAARIEQRPVTHMPRLAGTSSGGNLLVILRAFRELLTLTREFRQPPRHRLAP